MKGNGGAHRRNRRTTTNDNRCRRSSFVATLSSVLVVVWCPLSSVVVSCSSSCHIGPMAMTNVVVVRLPATSLTATWHLCQRQEKDGGGLHTFA